MNSSGVWSNVESLERRRRRRRDNNNGVEYLFVVKLYEYA